MHRAAALPSPPPPSRSALVAPCQRGGTRVENKAPLAAGAGHRAAHPRRENGGRAVRLRKGSAGGRGTAQGSGGAGSAGMRRRGRTHGDTRGLQWCVTGPRRRSTVMPGVNGAVGSTSSQQRQPAHLHRGYSHDGIRLYCRAAVAARRRDLHHHLHSHPTILWRGRWLMRVATQAVTMPQVVVAEWKRVQTMPERHARCRCSPEAARGVALLASKHRLQGTCAGSDWRTALMLGGPGALHGRREGGVEGAASPTPPGERRMQ